MGVLGGVWIFQFLLNIFYGDKSLQIVILVDDQQFFDAVLVENVLSLLEGGPDRNSDEIFFGHHFGDGDVEASFEAKIAIREDAD